MFCVQSFFYWPWKCFNTTCHGSLQNRGFPNFLPWKPATMTLHVSKQWFFESTRMAPFSLPLGICILSEKAVKEASLDQDEGNQASLADAVISRCRRRMHCSGTSLVGWLVGWLVVLDYVSIQTRAGQPVTWRYSEQPWPGLKSSEVVKGVGITCEFQHSQEWDLIHPFYSRGVEVMFNFVCTVSQLPPIGLATELARLPVLTELAAKICF